MGTTKKDLIDWIAKRTRTTQQLVKAVLQELFAEVVTGLGQNDRIELRDSVFSNPGQAHLESAVIYGPFTRSKCRPNHESYSSPAA